MSEAPTVVKAADKSPARESVIVLTVLAVIAAVAMGYYLATTLIPTPKVGILRVQSQVGSILAEVLSREITYLRDRGDVKAVVLVVDSPGGGAASGHDIYMQIRNLRHEMPVVASMDTLAASAAYQIGVGANEIYAKPATYVGNIGVISGVGQPEVLSERFITTGPFKTTGGNGTTYLQKLDLLHADFRDSVVAERSIAPNPLTMTPDQVATGEIWIGIEALQYGLIDHLGSQLDAVDRAAELAGLRHYEVLDIREEFFALLRETESAQYEPMAKMYAELDSQADDFDITKAEAARWPTFYQIYIPLE